MRLSLLVIASFVLTFDIVQGSAVDDKSTGYVKATASLRGNARIMQQPSPSLSLREKGTYVTPIFCKKKIHSLKTHALRKIHMLNQTLLLAEKNLTQEQSLRMAAQQNASSLASQLATLSQAHAELMDKLARTTSQLTKMQETQQLHVQIEKLSQKEELQLNDKLRMARNEEAKLSSKLQAEESAMKRMSAVSAQELNQHRQLAEMSRAFALINRTMVNQSNELKRTIAVLSAEEKQRRSATTEAKQLHEALQAVKKRDQKDVEQLTEARQQVSELTHFVADLTNSSTKDKAALQSKLANADREIESDKKEVASIQRQLSVLRDERKKLKSQLQNSMKSIDTEKVTAAKDVRKLKSELANATSVIFEKEKELKAAVTNAMERGTKLRKAESNLSVANSQVLQTDAELKKALHDARELDAKLHKTEVAAHAKDQQLKAASNVEKKLKDELEIAKVSIKGQDDELDEMSENAREVKTKLQAAIASAEAKDQKLKVAAEDEKELGSKLQTKDQELHVKDESLNAKDQELKAMSEETSKLGVKLQLLKVQKEQDLKAALNESESLKKKLAGLGLVKKNEDQALKAASNQVAQVEAKLHHAETELVGDNSEIQALKNEKAQLAKIRSSLRGVSQVAAKQTQAFRNFEYVDEQLRAELNNVVAMTPTPAEGTARMGMVEELPASVHDVAAKMLADTEVQPKSVSTTASPQDQQVQQEAPQDESDAKSDAKLPNASLLSSKVDDNADVFFHYLKDEVTDAPETGENDEDMTLQGEADFAF